MSRALGVGDAGAGALRTVYEELASCGDLRPGPRVDAAFGRLVDLVVSTPDDEAAAVLAHPAVRDVVEPLRALCFEGEYQLEAAWAARIAAGTDPAAELDRFPFAANYRLLHEMERAAVAAVGDDGPPPLRAAVVGSGPLPLTAFLLADEGLRVDCLDRDPAALAAAEGAAAALDVRGVSFHRLDVGGDGPAPGPVQLVSYDLVVLAALVGPTPIDKARAVAHLRTGMAPGALLLVRSARGLRTLLYPAVEPAALAGLDVLTTVHPTGEVINSVIVARTPKEP